MDQINLTAEVSITVIAAKVKNDRRKSVMKLTQAQDVSAKTFHAILHKDLLLSKSQPVGDQTALRGEEEGAIDNMQGNHSNDCRGFLTI